MLRVAWKNSGVEVDYRCKGGLNPWRNGQRSSIPGRKRRLQNKKSLMAEVFWTLRVPPYSSSMDFKDSYCKTFLRRTYPVKLRHLDPPLTGFKQMNHIIRFAFRKITVPAAWRMDWRGMILQTVMWECVGF